VLLARSPVLEDELTSFVALAIAALVELPHSFVYRALHRRRAPDAVRFTSPEAHSTQWSGNADIDLLPSIPKGNGGLVEDTEPSLIDGG
jgi:hypothetical protein